MKPQNTFKLLPLAAKLTIAVFGVAGLIAAAYAMLYQTTLSPGRILILLALAGMSARAKVKLYRETSLSFLTSVVLLAVITQGPGVAVLVGVFGVTVQSFLPKRRLVVYQAVFNAGMISVTVVATWWIHNLMTLVLPLATISAQTTATVLASFTYFIGNSISISLIMAVTKGISMFHVWSHHFLNSAPSFLIAGMLSLGVLDLASSTPLVLIAAVVFIIGLAYYCAIRLTMQTAS
jgi:hypothetical protein